MFQINVLKMEQYFSSIDTFNNYEIIHSKLLYYAVVILFFEAI
jgi:hypothetical protein